MSLESTFAITIAKIKEEIESSRIKASVTVNQYLLIMYWRIGHIILQQQLAEGWGSKVIERLSHDLRREFPDMKGISSRNLKYMRAFADTYPHFVH